MQFPPPVGAPRAVPPPPPPPLVAPPSGSTPTALLPPLADGPTRLAEQTATALRRPARGSVLPAISYEEVKQLLAERARLGDRLVELDAEGERLTRAVQRVGGVTPGPRPFTGAPPIRVASTSELDERLSRLTGEMQELTATISAQELKLQDLDEPSRRRRVVRIFVLLVVIAAAAGAAVYLAVR